MGYYNCPYSGWKQVQRAVMKFWTVGWLTFVVYLKVVAAVRTKFYCCSCFAVKVCCVCLLSGLFCFESDVLGWGWLPRWFLFRGSQFLWWLDEGGWLDEELNFFWWKLFLRRIARANDQNWRNRAAVCGFDYFWAQCSRCRSEWWNFSAANHAKMVEFRFFVIPSVWNKISNDRYYERRVTRSCCSL